MSKVKISKTDLLKTLNSLRKTYYEYSYENKTFIEINKYADLLLGTNTFRDIIESFIKYNYSEECCEELYKVESIEDIKNLENETIIEIFNNDNNSGFVITSFDENDNVIFKKVKKEVLEDFLQYFRYLLLYIPEENKLILTPIDVIDLYYILLFLEKIEEKNEDINLLTLLNKIKDIMLEFPHSTLN